MNRNPKLFVLAALLFLSCRQPPPVPSSGRVENADLAIAFAVLPAGFQVETNQGEELSFVQVTGESPGRMWVEVGELRVGGINLVEVISAQRELYEALPGGTFSGNQELMAPSGPAYYSRGRFQDGDESVEETRIFTLHPGQNRLLTLYYRYPAGEDSADRVNQILLLLGEVEALTPDDAGEGESADAAP